MWKFPNQFNTIILPHKCKLFFQRVFLPLSSLNSIPVPFMFREGCQHLFITTKQRTSCHYAIQIARSRTFCSLPPSLLFRIPGKGRATSTCWLQNHRCFPLPRPPPPKVNHLLGTTFFSYELLPISPSPPLFSSLDFCFLSPPPNSKYKL